MSTPTPDFTVSPRQYSGDDAWFGLLANPTGSINVPITDPYQVLRTLRPHGMTRKHS